MIRFGICNELFEGMDLARTCRLAREAGYEGLEIAPFTLAPLVTDLSHSRRRDARSVIHGEGLEVIGLHWLLAKTEGFHLTSPEAPVRRATASYLVALAEATHDLGGSLMVLGSPKQRNLLPGVEIHEAVDHAVEVLRAAVPAIAGCGVEVCLEPLAASETDFINSIAEAESLMARVDHPSLKLHLDVKAMSADPGGTIPDLIAHHAIEAGHFHAQDVNLRGPGMGEVDFAPILDALVAAGYDRWVSVEVFDYSPGAEETAFQSYKTLRHALDNARRHHP